jgi:hypothetical protein
MPSLRAPSVSVLIALGDSGRVVSGVCSSDRANERDYERLLAHRLGRRARLTSSAGRFGAPAGFARRHRLPHDQAPLRHEERAAAGTYVQRLRSWMRRFHGVATKYLTNYLAWHRFLHALGVSRCRAGPQRLLIVAFP